MEQSKNHPFESWILEIVTELGLFDLVDIPELWKQVIETLPGYLVELKPPDLELLWLFEGTGDNLADLFFQIHGIEHQFLLRIQKQDPALMGSYLDWFQRLEQALIERHDTKSNQRENPRPRPPKHQMLNHAFDSAWPFIKTILERIPVGAVVLDKEGKCWLINKALSEMTGLSQENLQSVEDIRRIIADDEQSIKVYKYFKRAAKGEEFRGLDFCIKTRSGHSQVFYLQTLTLPEDKFLAFLTPTVQIPQGDTKDQPSARDVFLEQQKTELDDLQARYSHLKTQLLDSFKIIERVTRHLKEDIDNFHSFAALLETTFEEHDSSNDDMATMVRISASLDEMMENLMEYAQLSLRRIHFDPIVWDGSLAADEVFSHLEDRLKHGPWKGRRVQIDNQVKEDTSIPLDFRIVTEILWQLTVNALSFSEGDIDVTASVCDSALMFHVKDQGVGIFESDMERIFLPLVRVNPSSIRGLGLGLAIVKAYCLLSNYKVQLFSAPAKGTEARLVIQPVPDED